jgi:hypothetical protein
MRILLALLCLASNLTHADYQATCEVPALINGSVVDRKDYPEIIWIGNCTATLVGPRVVATAAHCTGSSIAFSVGAERYTAKCKKSSHYSGNPTADYSFCFVDREVPGIEYASINIDPTYVVTGDWILQTGFGCTKWGAALDGKLRVGRSKVISVPSGTNNDITTGGEGSAVLCSGDSGGPAYGLHADGTRDLLISVNSRSNTTTRSYLSALATAQGLKFIEDFVGAFPEAKICGVDDQVASCFGLELMVPVTFSLSSSDTKLTVTVDPGLYKADKVKASLEAVGF